MSTFGLAAHAGLAEDAQSNGGAHQARCPPPRPRAILAHDAARLRQTELSESVCSFVGMTTSPNTGGVPDLQLLAQQMARGDLAVWQSLYLSAYVDLDLRYAILMAIPLVAVKNPATANLWMMLMARRVVDHLPTSASSAPPSSFPITVSLPPELRTFVEGEVAAGTYANPEAMVVAGLERLRELHRRQEEAADADAVRASMRRPARLSDEGVNSTMDQVFTRLSTREGQGTSAGVAAAAESDVDRALVAAERAIRRARAIHKALGVPWVTWENDTVCWIHPEDLPDLPEEDRPDLADFQRDGLLRRIVPEATPRARQRDGR